METIRFSVLIPVYNVEKYLSACIESVLNQTYRNFEIILVDDGSADKSGEICDDYARKYDNITVYHTENFGLLHARRISIEKATGDWYIFLDSDDTLMPETLQTVYEKANQYDCDCVIYKWQRVLDEKILSSMPTSNAPDRVITDKRELYNLVFNDGNYNSLCRKACKATLFDGRDYSAFYDVKQGEDLMQSLEIFENTENTVIIDKILYNYTFNPNSITHTVQLNNFESRFTPAEEIFKLVERENVFTEEDFLVLYNTRFNLFVESIKSVCAFKIKTSEKMDIFSKMKRHKHYDRLAMALKKKKINKRLDVIIFKFYKNGFYRMLICFSKIHNLLCKIVKR